jgi:hypothetical protein
MPGTDASLRMAIQAAKCNDAPECAGVCHVTSMTTDQQFDA